MTWNYLLQHDLPSKLNMTRGGGEGYRISMPAFLTAYFFKLLILNILSKSDCIQMRNWLTSPSCWTVLGLSPAILVDKNTKHFLRRMCWIYYYNYFFYHSHSPSISRSCSSFSLWRRSLKHSIPPAVTFEFVQQKIQDFLLVLMYTSQM